MPQRTPVFENLDEAKAFADEQSKVNTRARTVYRLEFDYNGSHIERFLVAQSVPRAYNHAFTLIRDVIGAKLGVAERKPGGFRPKSPEELVRSLSPEEIERVKSMLGEMSADSGEKKHSRRKKVEEQ